jgi:hypothetical protein
MEKTIYILTFIVFASCSSTDKNENSTKNNVINVDTTKDIQKEPEAKIYLDPYDSLANIKVDTSTLEGKREYIMNHFLIENSPSGSDYDTLFDLNFDGINDYVIGYYGQAGTGIKNRVKVYFYEIKKNSYILNEQLSDLPNPTFYIKQKKITGFYIGNGGGGGSRLEWINGKWTVTKEFEVDNQEEKTLWQIHYPIKNKTEKLIRPFQMIPPSDILETNIDF